jgi:hypothetical protein
VKGLRILLVNDTQANRRVLGCMAGISGRRSRSSDARVLATLDRGRTPAANGIVVL